MLLFAMFTLGYFFGVLITLFVFGRKEKVGQYSAVNSAKNSVNPVNANSWVVFNQLTKPNYPGDKSADIGKIVASQALQ